MTASRTQPGPFTFESARDVIAATRLLVGKCHPRLPGSPGCRRAAEAIREALSERGVRASLEEFPQHPSSFFLMGRIMAAGYVSAALLFLLGGAAALASALGLALILVYLIDEFLFLGRAFDGFFPRRPGANVVGVLEPSSDVRRQVVLVAHHDASPVCRFLERRAAVYAVRVILAFTFLLAAAAAIIVATADGRARPAALITLAAGAPFVVPMFWFYGPRASPGASDNLASSLMLVELAAAFRKGSAGTLEHTRLIFLSADGEECGQRGSAEFARTHKAELLSVPSFVFSMDTLGRAADLAFLKTDRNGWTRLSAGLTARGQGIAAGLGCAVKAVRFPLGGGGTDAGQFARRGIEAASLIGISTGLNRRGVVYHTSRDTAERIEPQAIEAGLNIAAGLIGDIDGAAGELGR